MSKTKNTTNLKYLTDKETVEVGNIKIIERDPGIDNYHPISVDLLRRFLGNINPKYLYGLKEIELRPKKERYITSLLGSYLRNQKKIILYSLTYIQFFPKDLADTWKSKIYEHNGKFKKLGETYITVEWSRGDALFWYVHFVLCHEIAHHYNNMNKFRRKPDRIKGFNESRTNKLAEKIYKDWLNNMAKEIKD